MSLPTVTKTVAVLGSSYGGTRAAQLLAKGLPKGWRVVVVDRNSHMNHVYVFPRYAVVPGHEHKAFIPYGPMFRRPDARPDVSAVFLHAQVTSLSPRSLTLSRAFPEHGVLEPEKTLNFDYAVYALGSHLPAPIDVWGSTEDVDVKTIAESTPDTNANRSPSALPLALETKGTKAAGIEWLKRYRSRIESASSILIVGGGALGVQYATDIADVFPDKKVTLLHSRQQLLPRFSQAMHNEILSTLHTMNITTILGERLDVPSLISGETATVADGKKERVVRTLSGREIRAELVLLCTGQKPNTALMAQAVPDAVKSSTGLIRVSRTMQVAVPATSHTEPSSQADGRVNIPYPHLFAIGDSADAFGAINSGRSSAFQANVAVQNILRLVNREEEGASGEHAELAHYEPDPPAIKVSLGLNKRVVDRNGDVASSLGGTPAMEAYGMWQLYGVETDEAGMHA
ncbi:hypothetical protein POSPLADRAFT_1056076 [Postia placenta MAD-698-R-SB12]|uniref:FAD/NAD(P)-binding domain-containing protein n=1 Tax=Postia placenta MAD-698-R-SB12 TaxID=670580 RepID=A0A1X6N2H7_9APHY|nr:hypothetical protein POSPLADRAFT_1056076 [Postia placenta MAD-698-R-SB12]OSX62710.1 hypothetical protein POSPLADRAFT_1056076 [Postia placenta MAD-698-R-SB12]